MTCLLVGDNLVKTGLIPHKLNDIGKVKERGPLALAERSVCVTLV